jgi:hypothetical protein
LTPDSERAGEMLWGSRCQPIVGRKRPCPQDLGFQEGRARWPLYRGNQPYTGTSTWPSGQVHLKKAENIYSPEGECRAIMHWRTPRRLRAIYAGPSRILPRKSLKFSSNSFTWAEFLSSGGAA